MRLREVECRQSRNSYHGQREILQADQNVTEGPEVGERPASLDGFRARQPLGLEDSAAQVAIPLGGEFP